MRLLSLLALLVGCAPLQVSVEEPFLTDVEVRAITPATATPRYVVQAKAVRTVDGDTQIIRADVWFDVSIESSCRLVEVEAPELVGVDKPEGLLWKAKLEELIPPQSKITVKALAKDKYGRPLILIERNGVSVNKALVEAMEP